MAQRRDYSRQLRATKETCQSAIAVLMRAKELAVTIANGHAAPTVTERMMDHLLVVEIFLHAALPALPRKKPDSAAGRVHADG
jgi:hypothetical protein